MKMARLAVIGLFILGAAGHTAFCLAGGEKMESGTLTVFFQEEKVGFEEFTWIEGDEGFELKVTGGMTKPFRMDVESMSLALNKDFIPLRYSFKGSMNGVGQEITSRIQDGRVESTIRVAGQENVMDAQVRRDTLVLPNPLFSVYLVLAKKFGCELKAKTEVSAYLIPQVEITGILEGAAGNPCAMTLDLAGVQILLVTDAQRRLVSLSIPTQNLRVSVQYAD